MLRLNIHTACLAAICSHSFYTGVRLGLAVVVLKLAQSPVTLGLVMMTYALLPALMSPWIGRRADQFGVRPLLHLCLWLLVLCGVALWRLPHLTAVLIVVAALVGLGFNTFAISIQKTIGGLPSPSHRLGESAPERRKRHFGTLATASSVSSFAGPMLTGWGLDHLGAGTVFGLLAMLPLLAWLLSLKWPLPPGAASNAAVANAASGSGAAPVPRSPLLTPALWPLALAIVMLTAAGDALMFSTPLIGQLHGLSATSVGMIVSSYAVGGFLIRLCSGLFIAKLSEWNYLGLTLLVNALLLLVFGQLSTVFALAGLSLVLGAWTGLAQPMTQSLMHQTVPEQRVGEALGTRLALVGGTQSASPLLLGLGVQFWGTGWTLALASLVLAASAAYVLRAARAAI